MDEVKNVNSPSQIRIILICSVVFLFNLLDHLQKLSNVKCRLHRLEMMQKELKEGPLPFSFSHHSKSLFMEHI